MPVIEPTAGMTSVSSLPFVGIKALHSFSYTQSFDLNSEGQSLAFSSSIPRISRIFDASYGFSTYTTGSNQQVLDEIKELCFRIIGRDIFKKEIGIVDGHDSSSYFWIMPVRVIDYENTASLDSVAEMRSVEIASCEKLGRAS